MKTYRISEWDGPGIAMREVNLTEEELGKKLYRAIIDALFPPVHVEKDSDEWEKRAKDCPFISQMWQEWLRRMPRSKP